VKESFEHASSGLSIAEFRHIVTFAVLRDLSIITPIAEKILDEESKGGDHCQLCFVLVSCSIVDIARSATNSSAEIRDLQNRPETGNAYREATCFWRTLTFCKVKGDALREMDGLLKHWSKSPREKERKKERDRERMYTTGPHQDCPRDF